MRCVLYTGECVDLSSWTYTVYKMDDVFRGPKLAVNFIFKLKYVRCGIICVLSRKNRTSQDTTESRVDDEFTCYTKKLKQKYSL